MLSHVFVSVTDFDRALPFYDALMRILGNEPRFVDHEKPWAGWHSAGRSRPYFVIGKPYDGKAQDPGNGQLIALAATSRQQVIDAYQAALDLGGSCEGPPGLRPEYHANYFGAYFRDPDGNKLCVASHGVD